jgi:photosystem II stability/assembly factor-like uncharacterized protein
MKILIRHLLALAAIFLLVACQHTTPTEMGNPVPPTQNQIGFTATLTQEPTLFPSPTQTFTPTSRPVATATRPVPSPTASPVPTALPTSTASPVPVLPPTATIEASQPITFTAFSMADDSVGWAVDEAFRHVFRTTDSGLFWIEVTPKNLVGHIINVYFQNAQSAWAFDYDNRSNLVHTADGGNTWHSIAQSSPLPPYATISFSSEKDGLAETYDVGAGQGYVTLFETHDSGATWNKIILGSPPNMLDADPGTLHLCNICGDRFYFDSLRMLVISGDFASDPIGKVHLFISADLGKTWKDLLLPMPSDQYADGLVAPQSPYFYTDQDGYLPIGIVKYNPDYTHAYDVLAIYTTHDGGLSWTPASTVLESVPNLVMFRTVVDFVSPMDAFAACGHDLCVSHDGAQTWQKLPASLNFTYEEGKDYVEWYDFTSPTAGWAIVLSPDNSTHTYWRSTDGGMTWVEFTPEILLP